MLRPLAILATLSLCACGSSSSAGPARASLTSYGQNAQEGYERALAEFRDDDCFEAEPIFRRVRADYPYSRFAALSELRIADCRMMMSDYPGAVTAYQQFVRFHPSHEDVPYARFRTAQAQYEQIPSEWFLSPPTHQRDQRKVHESLRLLRRFLLDFPEDERVAEARQLEHECLDILAQHELYAARFYLRRDAYPAVISRIHTLLTAYQGSGREAEALLLLGETYMEMQDTDQARATFERLVEQYPQSEEASEARGKLGQ